MINAYQMPTLKSKRRRLNKLRDIHEEPSLFTKLVLTPFLFFMLRGWAFMLLLGIAGHALVLPALFVGFWAACVYAGLLRLVVGKTFAGG